MINRPLFHAIVGVGLAAVSAGCVPKEGAQGVDDAGKTSCVAERQMMESAVEAYYALEGHNPALESELVPMYVRRESVTMDLDSNGNVVAAPGSGCI